MREKWSSKINKHNSEYSYKENNNFNPFIEESIRKKIESLESETQIPFLDY